MRTFKAHGVECCRFCSVLLCGEEVVLELGASSHGERCQQPAFLMRVLMPDLVLKVRPIQIRASGVCCGLQLRVEMAQETSNCPPVH